MAQITGTPTTTSTTARSHTAFAGQRHLGASINLWHVAAAGAALVASFWALVTDAVPALRALAADQAYFNGGNPLLFGQRRGGYALDTAREHLAALGGAASSYYADTYIALYDLAFPVLLLVFGLAVILYATNAAHAHVLDVSPAVQRLMLAVPVALFVFMMCENLFVYTMLEMAPKLNDKVVETASMFTQLKWLAGFIEGLLLTGLIVFTVHSHVEASGKA